ncbi:MAG: glycosyltransferase family 2 protein [Bacteroidetes bacterium]|nr:glycosyltransferase family 2 protein [Bacteroidota bacterium]
MIAETITPWQPGSAPVAVIIISLNEGHNMATMCRNLAGWAQEVFLLDSCSQDDTVGIALHHGVHVVQRKFTGFGDQWNFALQELTLSAPWTMKLDPDERLTDELKKNISDVIAQEKADGFSFKRRLWFMGKPLPVYQKVVRVWQTGKCKFSDVNVNEHPIVDGKVLHIKGYLEHYDSPDLEHWLEKQNRYTTIEAISAYKSDKLSDIPNLFGSSLQRRMWLKKNFYRFPFRYFLLFIFNWLWLSAWKAGRVGYIWARLRTDVMRLLDYKRREMEITGRLPLKRVYGLGKPDRRVKQFD